MGNSGKRKRIFRITVIPNDGERREVAGRLTCGSAFARSQRVGGTLNPRRKAAKIKKRWWKTKKTLEQNAVSMVTVHRTHFTQSTKRSLNFKINANLIPHTGRKDQGR